MNITEKSAYLKGLAEGIGLDPQKPETKIIEALLDLVADMTQKITELEEDVETLNDYADELDEDLGFVEELLYEDEDCDCDCDDCDFDCDCDCGCGCDEDEEGFRCLMCPGCGEKLYFDETMDPGDMVCPACGRAVADDDEDGTDEV